MITKESFLETLTKDTVVDRKLLLKIYGFDLSFPGFKEVALQKLESLGFANISEQYEKAAAYSEKHWDRKIKIHFLREKRQEVKNEK